VTKFQARHGLHGPEHRGCPTCDPAAGQPSVEARPRLSTVRVQARGDDFRIVQLQGELFVCTRQNGSCCCGWTEKGRLPFDPARLWGDEWERRKIRNRLHLTFTGCLGPCAVGNNALLQLHGRSIWLKDLNDPAVVPLVFDYAQAMLDAGAVLPVPEMLQRNVYERYLAPPDGSWRPLAADDADQDGLDRLDPVCLMEVDPATARHAVEYADRKSPAALPPARGCFLRTRRRTWSSRTNDAQRLALLDVHQTRRLNWGLRMRGIPGRLSLRSRARISLPEAGMAAWWNGRRKGPGREAGSDPAVAE